MLYLVLAQDVPLDALEYVSPIAQEHGYHCLAAFGKGFRSGVHIPHEDT